MGRIPIDYSTLPRSTDRRIRHIRNLGLLTMVIALLLRYEPPAQRLATKSWWQFQCARYMAPLDKIAFWGPYNTYWTAPSSPACFEHLAAPNLYRTLFLHRLKNSHGSCVVAIVLQSCDGDEHGETFRLDCIKINRDGSLSPIGTDWDEADSDKRSDSVPLADLTIFAGQVDQSDPSAFTITYSADGSITMVKSISIPAKIQPIGMGSSMFRIPRPSQRTTPAASEKRAVR